MAKYKQIHSFINSKGNRVFEYCIGEITSIDYLTKQLSLDEWRAIAPRQYIHGFKDLPDLTTDKIKELFLTEKFNNIKHFGHKVDLNCLIREGVKNGKTKLQVLFDYFDKLENLPFKL